MARRGHRMRAVLTIALAAALAGLVAFAILRPPKVAVDRVRRESVVLAVALTGRVAPRLEVELRSLVPGRLVTLTKREGDRVQEGEILGTVEVAEARAELKRAEAARQAQEARVEQARRERERTRWLHEREVAPQQELELSELDYEVAREELKRLVEAVAAARQQLDEHRIVAPFDGLVLARPVDPGQVVGVETLVYRIGTLGTGLIEVDVDERYLARLSEGMRATVAPLDSELEYGAELVHVGDEVDPAAGTALVRLAFEDGPADLPAGLSVDVNIVVDRYADALTVARQAVMEAEDGGERVLLVKDGELHERDVDILDWQAERVVVVEGLNAGDEVVLNPREHEPDEAVRPVIVEQA